MKLSVKEDEHVYRLNVFGTEFLSLQASKEGRWRRSIPTTRTSRGILSL